MIFIGSQRHRATEPRDHPSFRRMKEVSIGRSDVNLRRGERSAAQRLLPDEPFVVVFVEFGFEAGIRDVIRRRPFPNVADHLVTTVGASALWRPAYRSYAPELAVEEVRLH